MNYIQRQGDGYLETVDEFETRKEARAMLAEYRISDFTADYYISSRACKDWRDSKLNTFTPPKKKSGKHSGNAIPTWNPLLLPEKQRARDN